MLFFRSIKLFVGTTLAKMLFTPQTTWKPDELTPEELKKRDIWEQPQLPYR